MVRHALQDRLDLCFFGWKLICSFAYFSHQQITISTMGKCRVGQCQLLYSSCAKLTECVVMLRYILYACAIMGKLDPSFLERFGPNVDAIFHDVAHPLNGDATEVQPISLFFPLARHKSWFDGHSYETGLFPRASGKFQESSSEAINCYFGAYAWSLVRHSGAHVESDMTDFARLLLSMEIRSTEMYWQMIPASALGVPGSAGVYAPEFEENYMVGSVGMLHATTKTWLGNDPLHRHMNNVLPVTAVTAAVFSPNYVRYQYPYLLKASGDIEMTYKGYVVALHAIINATEAWTEAQDLNSWELETSLSKSEVLFLSLIHI